MKVNKKILNAIAANVIRSTIEANIETKTKQMREIGDAILDRIFEADGTTEFMKNAPKGYFEHHNQFMIGILKDSEFLEKFKNIINGVARGESCVIDSGSGVRIKCSERPIPNIMYWRALSGFSDADADIAAYVEVKNAVSDLELQARKASVELPQMLAQFKTIENLIKEIPEMKQYIPEEYLLPPTKALALRTEVIAGYINDLAA